MEIHHLRYFVAVAESGSFVAAAARLHMSASPLSRRIKDLEDELRTGLFVREYHQLGLTEAGSRLLPIARDIIRNFDGIKGLIAAAGMYTVHAIVAAAPEVSPALRSRFRQAFRRELPAAQIEFMPASSDPVIRAVLEGVADLGFTHACSEDPRLESVAVESQPLGIAVSAQGAFAGRTSLTLSEIAHLPWVSVTSALNPLLYQRIDDVLRSGDVHKRVFIKGAKESDLVYMVSSGEAFSVIPVEFGATRKAFLEDNILVLPLEGLDLDVITYAVWRIDRQRESAVIRTMAAIVRREFALR